MEVAMMNNGRPLTKKQAVRLMVGLTILAWATETLLKQWGFGQEISTTAPAGQVEPEPAEKFVPGSPRYLAGATLEMRSEATVIGGEVRLKQVCRWSDQDKAIFDPIGDLVLVHLSAGKPFEAISMRCSSGSMPSKVRKAMQLRIIPASHRTIPPPRPASSPKRRPHRHPMPARSKRCGNRSWRTSRRG
jgi:hypothetical protein